MPVSDHEWTVGDKIAATLGALGIFGSVVVFYAAVAVQGARVDAVERNVDEAKAEFRRELTRLSADVHADKKEIIDILKQNEVRMEIIRKESKEGRERIMDQLNRLNERLNER